MNDEYLLEVIQEQRERLTDLAKSYRILNDNHTRLELEFVKLQTEIHTVIKIVKWLVPGSAILSGIVLIVKLLELMGMI